MEAHAQQSFRPLDILFSHAGTMPIEPSDDLAVDEWETMAHVDRADFEKMIEDLKIERIPGLYFIICNWT